MRRISFRFASQAVSLWGQVSLSASRGAKREEIKRERREPPRKSLQNSSMHMTDLVHREVSRSCLLCFAALLRRMIVFTTCWKRRKKKKANAAAGPLLSRENTCKGPRQLALFRLSVLIRAPFAFALSHPSAPSFCAFVTPDALLNPRQKAQRTIAGAENGPLTDSSAKSFYATSFLAASYRPLPSLSHALLQSDIFSSFSRLTAFLPQSYDTANDASSCG